jgi:uncharacterized protein YneF (UPF0154 family)
LLFLEINVTIWLLFTKQTVTPYQKNYEEGFLVSKVTIVLLVILAILIVGVVVLYFVGKRLQKKQEAQQEQINAAAQSVSMLIIDKKKVKMKDSGLPAAVIAQTPKMMRRSKVPVVKAKVGPRISTFLCDAEIFDTIPVKKEVKAIVSGLYITSVKGLHRPIVPTETKKPSLRTRLKRRYNEASAQLKK